MINKTNTVFLRILIVHFMYSHNPLSIYMSNPLQIHTECNIIAKLGIFFLVFSANIKKSLLTYFT